MAVTAKDLRPGKTGSGGASSRLYPAITGFPFPIGPTFARRTIRYEVRCHDCRCPHIVCRIGLSRPANLLVVHGVAQVVPGQVWTFEQPQKLSGTDVHINVRMTAIKLRSGGLLIYAPIAPTRRVASCKLSAALIYIS